MPRVRKPLSRARRITRIAVWTTLAVVVTLRYGILRNYYERFHREQREEARRIEGMDRVRIGGPQDWRSRRRPTEVRPASSEVPANLYRIRIEIPSAGVEALRGYRWNGWNGQLQERPKVKATVRENDTVFTNVSLHLKGAAGSFRPFDDKPALTLKFSKAEPAHDFHGYPKISLNNSVQDPTYLCEILCRELFEAAGVPVPRADHATVLLNGRDLGLFVMTEGFGKPFLRRYFSDVRGNLYDGGFLQDVDGPLETNSGDHPDDRSDLDRLAAASEDPDPDRRWDRLGQVLDVDRFMTFLALEVLTGHWDGYGMNRNNYRLFHDLETDRMVFIPHGMDQMFGASRSSPRSPIFPAMRGIVARAVLSVPQGRQMYLERLAKLRAELFTEERLTQRIRELAERIRPTLAAYGEDWAQRHDALVADLTQRIVERVRSVSEQLTAPQESILSGTESMPEIPERPPFPPPRGPRFRP